jgi:hypothetical protein
MALLIDVTQVLEEFRTTFKNFLFVRQDLRKTVFHTSLKTCNLNSRKGHGNGQP